jgi:purine-binding chemotaxis protein CheW
VDAVHQVDRVSMADVEDPPMDRGEFIRGIVRREEDLVVWVTPTKTVESSG